MAELGRRNLLRVVRSAPPGVYLESESLGEILLPNRYVSDAMVPGAKVDVFVYRDSEDRLVATTESPRVMAGEFACLRAVKAHAEMGAFLDWGLSKDLLLPASEQMGRVRTGDEVVVYVLVDPRSDRIIATMRIDEHLGRTAPRYEREQHVRLLIANETPLGYNAIIEDAHLGLLYRQEIPTPLRIGQELDGYVRGIRPDGKIDLTLDRAGYRRIAPLTGAILDALVAEGGRIEFDDSSAPEEIRARFGVSKKAFKQALGALFRAQRIRFKTGGTELVEAPLGTHEKG